MIIILFINVLTYWGMGKLMEPDPMLEDLGLTLNYDMTSSLLQAAYNGSFSMIAGVVIAIFVCLDYSQGTIKTVIAKGYSRTKVYFAKLIGCSAISVFMYICALLFGWLFGIMFFGFTPPDNAKWLAVLGVQFVSVIALSAFSFFLSAVLRKVAPAIVLILVIPIVIELILIVIDLFAETHISDYWISTVFNSLTSSDISTERILWALFASMMYVGAFIVSGWGLSRKYSY